MKPIIKRLGLGESGALALSLLWGFVATVGAQIPAFPGAEGFGAYATGGRGGDVYTVTNLNGMGAGSLRYGIENAPAQGRTIVFAVSGYIPIANNTDTGNKTIRIVPNKVTVAGQTAPGDGIGLKDGRLLLTGNNAVIRHLRIRHGKYGGAGDCVNLDSSAANSILDHVSLMFSTDENISFFSSTLDNFTMQYSTSSWGMERHNAGGLWDLEDGTCHHTLWAHHRTRNPKARPYGLLEWINNVTYHWRGEGFIMGDSQSNVEWRANVRGCYFLSIPDHQFGVDQTALSKARVGNNGQPNFALYLDNCLHDSNNNGLLDGTDKGYGVVAGTAYPAGGTVPGTQSYELSPAPFPGAGGSASVIIDPPLTAYKKVISSAGALRLDAGHPGPVRDELDTLLINSVENQESILLAKDTPLDANDTPSNGEALLAAAPYNISNGGFGTLNSTAAMTDSDGDGMPDDWETALGWNSAAQDHNTALASSGGIITGLTFMPANTPAGYTRLEEYLHFRAIPHAFIGVNAPLSVDLRRYTGGFKKSPVTFTFTNASNGTVSLQPDGYTAVFSPAVNHSGRARFDFTVTDGDGSTWKQTLGVLVKAGVTAPPAPTGLTASPGNSQVTLAWNASVGATGYQVKRATTPGGPYTTISSTTGTSHVNTGLINGTTYYFVVSAMNGALESATHSNEASATPNPGSTGTSTTLQAEASTFGGGVAIESNNAGFNGTGFANFPVSGGFAQFDSIDGGGGGAATLSIRYALGGTNSTRTGVMLINGNASPLTFTNTGAWTTWVDLTVAVTLAGGTANTIRFESNGSDLGNLDQITVNASAALPVVTVTASDPVSGEFGNDRSLAFTLTRTGSTAVALTVYPVAAGTATAGSDYSGLAGGVMIPAGQSGIAVPLTVLPDALAEGMETVTLSVVSSGDYTSGSPSSAIASIQDAPSQNFYFSTISDPSQRGAIDDPDRDSTANVIEYFMGTLPGDAGSHGALTIPSTGQNTFKVRYPRAKNRPDVSGSLRWSADLEDWFSSGQSNGSHAVTFVEAVVSDPTADPEIVEATATITGQAVVPTIFIRLAVQ